MAKIQTFVMTLETMTRDANAIKELFATALMNAGYLTEDQVDEINKNYAVILSRQNMLGKVLSKWLFGDDVTERTVSYAVARIVKESEEDEENHTTGSH